MARQAAYRKRKTKNSGTMLLLFFLIALFFGMGMGTKGLRERNAALEEKRQELMAKIEEQEEYTRQLEEFKKYTGTKKYAEEVAKEKLGLVYEDEIVFRPR